MRRPSGETVSHERLLELLSYDPVTGIFRWRRTISRTMAGEIAGCVKNMGYRQIAIDGPSYLAHRLAWFYTYGKWPQALIDHIDRNALNNAIANLREATSRQNGQNACARGYSIFVGKTITKYVARIAVDGKYVALGRFDSPEAARAAYIAAHKKYFGEFSGYVSSEAGIPDVSAADERLSSARVAKPSAGSFDDGIPEQFRRARVA